jgi:hypothetical protein
MATFSPTIDAAYQALKRVVVALDACTREQTSLQIPLSSAAQQSLVSLSTRYTELVANIVTVVQSATKALSDETLLPQDVFLLFNWRILDIHWVVLCFVLF